MSWLLEPVTVPAWWIAMGDLLCLALIFVVFWALRRPVRIQIAVGAEPLEPVAAVHDGESNEEGEHR